MYCLQNCHQGHNIGPITTGRFFCDCKCRKSPHQKIPVDPSSGELFAAKNFHNTCTRVALGLSGVLGENCAYSPLSITYILSLVHQAAIANTGQELTNLMGAKNTMEDLASVYKLFNNDFTRMANIIVANNRMPINPAYLEMFSNVALVSNEDFANPTMVAGKINTAVSGITNNLITNMVDERMVNSDTCIILTNVVYFKANWNNEFNEHSTRMEKFNNQNLVPMMIKEDYFPYYEDASVQIVEMPFHYSGLFLMGVILPRDHSMVSKCYGYLHNEQGFTQQTNVLIHFPKFTQRNKMDLIPFLYKLGLVDIFTQESRLDKMVTDPSVTVKVSTLLHEAVIIVDEKGTEAAAATSMECATCVCIPPKPVIFNANHTFVYYIRHVATNVLLFVGTYNG